MFLIFQHFFHLIRHLRQFQKGLHLGMIKNPLILAASLAALILSSCSSSNPQSRIQKNPTIYNDLSPKQQELVRTGQIEQGMTKPAVFLAMGKADSEQVKVEGTNTTERWNYTSLQPVYRSSFSFGFGNSFGRRGRGRGRSRGSYGHYGLGYSPSLAYVPRLSSSVYFTNDLVSGWEGIRR